MSKNKEIKQIYKRPTVRITQELHAKIKIELVKISAREGKEYTFQKLISDLLEKWIEEVAGSEE